MKKIAVILSGCGRDDGSEIHESVLTLLALDRAGAKACCLAPNMPQHRVVNQLTGDTVNEQRNVLVESARIARGEIQDLATANPDDYDGVILPGGFGAALNLCDFGLKGADCEVNPNVKSFVQAIAKAGKPAGFICIAPAMISKIYGPGIKHTIGTDASTAEALKKMGADHQDCAVTDLIIDAQHKVVSTPAYMLAKSINEAAIGIEKLVQEVLRFA